MNHRNTAYPIPFISNFYKLILFENLFKQRQRRLTVLKYSLRLVCSLIFIEYD